IFMVPRTLLIFDHRLRSFKIVANAFLADGSPEKAYAQAAESIEAIMAKLAEPANLPFVPTADCEPEIPRSNFRPDEFNDSIEPRSTFAPVTFFRWFCHSASNPSSKQNHSISIAASAL